MADDFGLKIGVEGEREFKKALSEINQTFKVLGSEMSLVTSQFDKNDKSIQSVTARNAVLNKEIDAQKDKISTLKAALDNAASSFGENDRRIALEVKESSCKECGDLCGDSVDCRVWVQDGIEYTEPPKSMIINAILKEVYDGHSSIPLTNEKYEIPQNLITFFDSLERKED